MQESNYSVVIQDQSAAGAVLGSIALEMAAETVTARELIRSRVYQEVCDYQQSERSDVFRGLVRQHAKQEETPIDWRIQYEIACQAFEANQLLILVDEQQVESLDQKLKLTTKTSISFLKLVVLVGG